MKLISFIVVLASVSFMACRPELPDEIPLPTKICVRILHHTWPIPKSTVYIKYNTDSFPGYDKPVSFFDASFQTGQDARGCIESVPEGRHWLIAFGHDSLYFPHFVFGSLRAEISLKSKPVLDTVLYVAE